MSRYGVLAIIVVSLMQSGCASVPPTCKLDPQLLPSWSSYHLMSESRSPYVADYRACGKHLVFVAAHHSNDPNGATFALVRQAFVQTPVQFVIVEGFPQALGESPRDLIDYANQVNGRPDDGEPYLAIRLAHATGVPFSGGEPTDREILQAAAAQDVSVEDVFGFYILRNIEQWRREETISGSLDPNLDVQIRRLSSILARNLGVAPAIATADQFKAWYARTNGIAFDQGYRPEDAYPEGPNNERRTNRISDVIGDAREHHILAVVAAALREHDVVLVVYGASHELVESRALDAALGTPRVTVATAVVGHDN